MATDRDIEQFIGDSFASIWDLEVLSVLLENPDRALMPADLIIRMRASDRVVEQGIRSLTAAGIATVDGEGALRFQPVNDELADCARQAADFYSRFAGRARRIIVARQSPGLDAFADAFRWRKD